MPFIVDVIILHSHQSIFTNFQHQYQLYPFNIIASKHQLQKIKRDTIKCLLIILRNLQANTTYDILQNLLDYTLFMITSLKQLTQSKYIYQDNSNNMRTTNSRDKYAKQNTIDSNQNRLLKTSGSTRSSKNQQPGYTRPSSGKKIQAQKNMQTKVIKKQYVVEDNMTESRICQAKMGLQLLKKKMSTKGMSRQKINTMTKIPEEKPSLKSMASKGQTYQNQNSNIPPRKIEKKQSQHTDNKKLTPKIPTKKTISEQEKPERRTKPQQAYQQPQHIQEQIPIKPKKDFNALLQEQMRKQAMKQQPAFSTNYQEQGQIQLVQCREGCGRMFSTQAIQKHQKVCQKVFQSKRKAFDSASHRAPQVQGFNKPPSMENAGKKTANKKVRQEKKQTKTMPKWKAQSLAFRASMKNGKGQKLSEQEQKATEGNLVQCKFCGRKFNQTAATRHIPFCEKKSKQIPAKRR